MSSPAEATATASAPAPVAAKSEDKKKDAAKPVAADASGGGGAAAGGAGAAPKKKKAVDAFEYVNTTPAGDKKDMTAEMLPAYHPQAVEAAWDAWWEKKGFFKADAAKAAAAGEDGRFVMVIPPPNVTGSLHLGHALTDSIEDCLTRWHRMNGRPVLWLPGTDHAGIATQAVVEKRLAKDKGITRHDLGREAFVKEVWAWKEEYGSRIYDQMRHLGVSTDWSRSAFTMDDNLSRAVSEAFIRLHERGLIYRDTKLVNWCSALKTAISDIEVEYIDIEKRVRRSVPGHDPARTYEFGTLTSFSYRVAHLANGDKPPADAFAPAPAPTATEGGASTATAAAGGSTTTQAAGATAAQAAPPNPWEIVVATTRLETMLGDVAVAVHPDDPRYTHLHGARLIHPFFPDRVVTVITDGELVDPAFGTGAVKITPAHDPNDYKCGKKHGLQFITVFDENGKINANGGPLFAGMMRFDARWAVEKALQEKGLFRGKADNKMRLGVCSRTGDVIEPLIKPQWYVKCADMGAAAANAVRTGQLRLVPEYHAATWYHWLDNIQDWCISRQLWWGHRIPAYFVTIEGDASGGPANTADERYWVVARTREEALALAADRFKVSPAAVTLSQDEDVLDTWFSSGLFPFATLGWPNTDHPDFKAFYPNTILETGHDILFFWVARMVMMGQTLTGQLPFKTVYLHAMVRDKYGRKMSKSLGNVIDPLECIYGCSLDSLHEKVRAGNLPAKEVEQAIKGQKLDYPEGIPECGADALRFGLLGYTVQGRDVNMDVGRIVGYRQFCNKLWNATRFALTHLAADRFTPPPLLDAIDELAATGTPLAPRDRWILSRLNAAITSVTQALHDYQFGVATQAAYDFWLYELCDYYLELLKPLLAGNDATAATATGGNVAEAQRLARVTLWVCLDMGLRLLHPFMPFVSEELWQRLPGRGNPWRAAASSSSITASTAATGGGGAAGGGSSASGGAHPDPESIMIAPWPTPIAGASRPDVEADFALYQTILRAGRALRSDAEIPPSKEATFYVATEDEARLRVCSPASHHRDLCTLLKASSLTIVAAQSAVEEGCSVSVVDDKVSIHLLLKGLIDPVAELKKLASRAANVQKEVDRITRKQGAPGYADRSPADVKAADTEALAAARSQLAVLGGLKAQYEEWAKAASASAATGKE